MIFSFLFQAFFLTLFPPSQPLTVEASNVVNEEGYQFVEGFDEATRLSFSHSLPVDVNDEFSFGPQRTNQSSLGILTTAQSALVMDRRTRRVLFEEHGDEQRSIASLTKLMTAVTLLDLGIDFEQEFTITKADYRAGGKIHFYPGEVYRLQDIWLGGLIASDNVAIAALVRSTGLSEPAFVELMNQKADELGMSDSSFIEPTGIHSLNLSTARDLALLLDEALSLDAITDAVRRPSYAFKPLNTDREKFVQNTNELLTSFVNEEPYTLLGGKTGFTYDAGYCLGVIVDGPQANDDIIVIVLGAKELQDRFLEVKGLVDWTFDHYRW